MPCSSSSIDSTLSPGVSGEATVRGTFQLSPGANGFGIPTCWFNFEGQRTHDGIAPGHEIHQLAQLLPLLED